HHGSVRKPPPLGVGLGLSWLAALVGVGEEAPLYHRPVEHQVPLDPHALAGQGHDDPGPGHVGPARDPRPAAPGRAAEQPAPALDVRQPLTVPKNTPPRISALCRLSTSRFAQSGSGLSRPIKAPWNEAHPATLAPRSDTPLPRTVQRNTRPVSSRPGGVSIRG